MRFSKIHRLTRFEPDKQVASYEQNDLFYVSPSNVSRHSERAESAIE